MVSKGSKKYTDLLKSKLPENKLGCFNAAVKILNPKKDNDKDEEDDDKDGKKDEREREVMKVIIQYHRGIRLSIKHVPGTLAWARDLMKTSQNLRKSPQRMLDLIQEGPVPKKKSKRLQKTEKKTKTIAYWIAIFPDREIEPGSLIVDLENINRLGPDLKILEKRLAKLSDELKGKPLRKPMIESGRKQRLVKNCIPIYERWRDDPPMETAGKFSEFCVRVYEAATGKEHTADLDRPLAVVFKERKGGRT